MHCIVIDFPAIEQEVKSPKPYKFVLRETINLHIVSQVFPFQLQYSNGITATVKTTTETSYGLKTSLTQPLIAQNEINKQTIIYRLVKLSIGVACCHISNWP